MTDARTELDEVIARELGQPVPAAVLAMADVIRSRHAEAALAVLFYGSCLRQPETMLADSLLDFYLLVDDYRAAYRNGMMALANRLLPPNVFYLEIPHGGATLRCKYAVISLAQFRAGMARDAHNVSLWARFSQQSRLVWARDAAVADAVKTAAVEATLTMIANVLPIAEPNGVAAAIWARAFLETYRAELRSEGPTRAGLLVAADHDRYQRVAALARGILADEVMIDARACKAAWRRRRRISKLLNIVRLLKATFTFEGALDYALWKIKRHSGVSLPVTDWQRRHPLLSAPILAWKLYRRGAFR